MNERCEMMLPASHGKLANEKRGALGNGDKGINRKRAH